MMQRDKVFYELTNATCARWVRENRPEIYETISMMAMGEVMRIMAETCGKVEEEHNDPTKDGKRI